MSNRQINRRSFLTGALAAMTALGASALAACAPRENAVSSSSGEVSSAGTDAVASPEASTAEFSGSSSAQEYGSPVHVDVPKNARVLLVYFSRPGMNNDGMGTGKYRDLKIGYTKTVAGYMEDELGCDAFEIEAADPYPHDYRKTVARNVDEEENEIYPEIANIRDLKSIDGYDVIIMGSPVWNSQSPMIMRTFLRSFDFSGKIILPFTTYDMSGLGSVPDDYAEIATRAQVSDAGLSVYETDAEKKTGRQQAHQWLASCGLVES